ncbi:MAG: hypothetical protein LC644_13060, partial [Pseudonocardia sp.]|nr:hypothetical protein [Pseudonocardia sp.]
MFGASLLVALIANGVISSSNMESKRWNNTSYSEAGRNYVSLHQNVDGMIPGPRSGDTQSRQAAAVSG